MKPFIDKKHFVKKNNGFKDMGFAKVDTDRTRRNGFSEVLYCEGKTPSQCAAIFRSLMKDTNGNILGTRCDETRAAAITEICPHAVYDSVSHTVTLKRTSQKPCGNILILSAGTSDMAVAEEAAVTAEIMGNKVTRVYDVGVSGIHRLLAHEEELSEANVLVVVAGMDGALPSVVGGLVNKPVIAVPTDVGYGASLGGLSALLAMLNSCAPGITVVNINNGFGAAVAASRINQLTK